MRIGELAQRSGTSTSRIRFYEAQGLMRHADRRVNGYRDYPAQAIETLRIISAAQELGFSLSEIRTSLSDERASLLSKAEILAALQDKLVALDQHIAAVQMRRERLISCIGDLHGQMRDAGQHAGSTDPGLTTSIVAAHTGASSRE